MTPARHDADLLAWRACRLRTAGFSRREARLLAADDRVDLHALLGLIDRGCPPLIAARITAPLDGDPPLERDRNGGYPLRDDSAATSS